MVNAALERFDDSLLAYGKRMILVYVYIFH